MVDLILTERSNITAVADSVRNKIGLTGELTLGDIIENVNAMSLQREIILQEKTITPTEEEQIVSADNGYDGISEVTVTAIPSDYINKHFTLTNNVLVIT